MNFIVLILGFLFLVKGADFFVEGASSIAKKFNISPMLIGLTIVAFGTSAPEMAVSISAALKGSNDIAFGNVLGSNIFNMLCVVGASAFLNPFKIQKSTLNREFPFLIITNIVLVIIAFDSFIFGNATNVLSRVDGLILLVFFGVFLGYLYKMSKTQNNEEEDIEVMSFGKSFLFGVVGLIGIIWGGDLVVNSASNIAIQLGMSKKLVALTIVAIGTSLPELVTSIVAATKNQSEIAIGNVIGSNLFNILLILGTSAVIHPINVNGELIFDVLYLLVVTIITYIFAISKKSIKKSEGLMLILLYVGYMAFIISRN